MKVALFGATGRIGGLVLDELDRSGTDVVVVARRDPGLEPRPNLRVILGDVRDAAATADAVAGSDAVISALGARRNTPSDAADLRAAMEVLVEAMTTARARRLVLLSGAGITVPGEEKPLLDRVATRIVRRVAAHVVAAKQAEFDVASRSDLEWTAVRPPLVTDGALRGYRLAMRLEAGARVTRRDVAAAIASQVTDREFIRRAPFVLPRR